MKSRKFNPQSFLKINKEALRKKLDDDHPDVITLGDLQFSGITSPKEGLYRIRCIVMTGMEEYDPEEIDQALIDQNIWNEQVDINIDINQPTVLSIEMIDRCYQEWIEEYEKEILEELNDVLDEDLNYVQYNQPDTTGGQDTIDLNCTVYAHLNNIHASMDINVVFNVKPTDDKSHQEIKYISEWDY